MVVEQVPSLTASSDIFNLPIGNTYEATNPTGDKPVVKGNSNSFGSYQPTSSLTRLYVAGIQSHPGAGQHPEGQSPVATSHAQLALPGPRCIFGGPNSCDGEAHLRLQTMVADRYQFCSEQVKRVRRRI